jgi:ABC-type Mn2+/Zn2+ transport system permease subunit
MSIGQTILVGIAGSLIAGVVGQLLFGRPGGFILAVLCSLGIVYLIRRSRERRLGGTAATRWR